METRRRRGVVAAATAAAVSCGAGIAVQARINGQLAAELGDAYLAALISFGSGLVILCLVVLVLPSSRSGIARVRDAIAKREIPWWYICGGAAGALFIFTQSATSAILGVALFSIGIVCGQTVSGVLIDRAGLGTMHATPITPQRLGGAVLALAAVALAGSSEFQGGTSVWLFVLPFISGVAISWQQAVNGQVKEVAASAFAAAFVNFVVGTIVLVIAVAVHTVIVGWPDSAPGDPVLYLGGAVGVIFLALGARIVGTTGVLLLTLGIVGGQLVMSILLDAVIPLAGDGIHWTTIAATALALVAVVIVALSRKPLPRTKTTAS